MDDREFFDKLYQGWAKTTGAEDCFWMPVDEDNAGTVKAQYIDAVDKNGDHQRIGWIYSEKDAAFITALHGCFADLCRRLHEALDEADRCDLQRDESQQELAALALQLDEVESENADLRRQLAEAEASRQLHMAAMAGKFARGPR